MIQGFGVRGSQERSMCSLSLLVFCGFFFFFCCIYRGVWAFFFSLWGQNFGEYPHHHFTGALQNILDTWTCQKGH